MANLLFAFRESDSLRSENPGMSQPSRGLVSDRDSRLGPPVEVCAGFELIAIENTTALGDDLLEIGQGLEAQMIGHMRHGAPPRLMAPQSIGSTDLQESHQTPSPGNRITGQARADARCGSSDCQRRKPVPMFTIEFFRVRPGDRAHATLDLLSEIASDLDAAKVKAKSLF